MALQFTEYFLYITMASPELGNKRYGVEAGASHTINAFTVQDRREAAVESYVTGQSSTPMSHTMGRMLDGVTIEFPIKNLTEKLAELSAYRVVNVPKNIFMCSSVLTVTGNDNYKEFPSGSKWYVESFSIKRNAQRKLRIGSLSLKRWYGDLPT